MAVGGWADDLDWAIRPFVSSSEVLYFIDPVQTPR